MASTTPVKPNDEFRETVIHFTSWGCLIAGPIILALPPRKLDLYTLGILLGTFAGANEVSREQTGISMIDRMGQRFARSTAALPPQAIELQQRIREERERKNEKIQKAVDNNNSLIKEEYLSKEDRKSSTFWGKVWMGGEGENWKEERLRKEREALESGKGYFDLIMDQVLEVWNSGEKKGTNNIKSNDEKNPRQEKSLNNEVGGDEKK